MTEQQISDAAVRLQHGLVDALKADPAAANSRVLGALPFDQLSQAFSAVARLTTPGATMQALLDYTAEVGVARAMSEPTPERVIDNIVAKGIEAAVPILAGILNEENWEWDGDRPIRCQVSLDEYEIVTAKGQTEHE